MRSQFLTLLRNEITKAARRKLPYFGILIIGFLCGIIYFVAGKLSNAATANGWGYVGFSMQLVYTDIGPIFTVAFASMLMAEETGSGTIRSALAAPVHRWELYLAKAATGLLYMMALSLAAVTLSAALGATHYAFGNVSDASGIIYTREQVGRELLAGYALSWLPLSALVMAGLLISTLIRNAGAAVAVGVSALFVVEFTKHLVGLDPYIFTRYTNFPWVTLQQIAQGMDYQWRPEVWRMAILSGAWATALFGGGLVYFVRQDLNH